MATYAQTSSSQSTSQVDDGLYSRVSWKIVPLLLIAYMVAYLDRINIGYAQLQMKQTLPFSDAVYGLGAGMFFIGYLLFEVPSNLLLEKIGARKTLLRIMVLWGIVAAGMAFVTTPTQFYIGRVLLGVFEAGFFPGVILYFTYWYPSVKRGQVIALFMTATTIISVFAGPISGAILKFCDGAFNLYGWQWLFIVQGLPASILGVIIFFTLKDKPELANWLSSDDKRTIAADLARDAAAIPAERSGTFRDSLRDPKIYALGLVLLLLVGATYVMVFWLPTLIKSWGVNDVFMVGIYAAIPNAVGVIGMVLIGRSSDRMRERRWHFGVCCLIAVVGLLAASVAEGNLVASILALCFAVIGIASATPLFFTLVSEYMPPSAAAGGIALVSSLGNLGPAVTPSINGMILQATGKNVFSLYFVISLYLLAGLLLVLIMRSAPRGKSPRS